MWFIGEIIGTCLGKGVARNGLKVIQRLSNGGCKRVTTSFTEARPFSPVASQRVSKINKQITQTIKKGDSGTRLLTTDVRNFENGNLTHMELYYNRINSRLASTTTDISGNNILERDIDWVRTGVRDYNGKPCGYGRSDITRYNPNEGYSMNYHQNINRYYIDPALHKTDAVVQGNWPGLGRFGILPEYLERYTGMKSSMVGYV